MSAMKNEQIRRIDSPETPVDWLLRALNAVEEAKNLLGDEYDGTVTAIWTTLTFLSQAVENNERT